MSILANSKLDPDNATDAVSANSPGLSLGLYNWIMFGNYNLWLLKLYNEPSPVYFIKAEGRIHLYIKG